MRYNGKVLAKAIRDRRLKLNYTQEYVATQLHISQNAYSKFELGFTNITLIRFVQLCQALEIEMYDLLKPVLQAA